MTINLICECGRDYDLRDKHDFVDLCVVCECGRSYFVRAFREEEEEEEVPDAE